jgi:hypothetical protein
MKYQRIRIENSAVQIEQLFLLFIVSCFKSIHKFPLDNKYKPLTQRYWSNIYSNMIRP